MSVKRYDPATWQWQMFSHPDGNYVLHTDYAALEARHNALREAVAWYMERELNERRQFFGRFDGLCEAGKSWSTARAEVDRLIANESAADCKGEG